MSVRLLPLDNRSPASGSGAVTRRAEGWGVGATPRATGAVTLPKFFGCRQQTLTQNRMSRNGIYREDTSETQGQQRTKPGKRQEHPRHELGRSTHGGGGNRQSVASGCPLRLNDRQPFSGP